MILQERKSYRLKTDDNDVLEFTITSVDRIKNTVVGSIHTKNGVKLENPISTSAILIDAEQWGQLGDRIEEVVNVI